METRLKNETAKVPPSEARPDESFGRGFREAYLLHLADTTLILSQRNSEWCGHGPILEQDIAITNISLDLIGQARNFYQYAAVLINKSNQLDGSNTSSHLKSAGGEADEDQLAYLRKEREFKNLLLVEQPNGDWAQTILRQYLFSQFQFLLYQQLQNHTDEQLAAIAAKALKETTYHLRWSSEWVVRLGDGTEESHKRMNHAIDELWRYTGEMFEPCSYEKEMNIDLNLLKNEWMKKVILVFDEATISSPFGGSRREGTEFGEGAVYMQTGGKEGLHTEHLGFILTELQYMQRTYPASQW